MAIGFFISNHGFGHLMRNLPVIRQLLETTEEHLVLVCSEKHNQLAKEYLLTELPIVAIQRVTLINFDTDIGLKLKPFSLDVDRDATESAVRTYVNHFDELVLYGIRLLQNYQISKSVIDIVPWGITASKKMGIPSILIASFTWIEQYEPLLPVELVEFYQSVYEEVDVPILLELANQPTVQRFPNGVKVELIARKFHREEVKKIKSACNRPIVFLSIGGSNSGIDTQLNVENLPYFFIATEGLNIRGNNSLILNKETKNTQDYVMASDYCISKAGWSTLSEIMLARKPMALIQRPDVTEDQLLIKQLTDRKSAIGITVNELENIESILMKLTTYEFQLPNYKNDYDTIAKIILNTY